MQSLSIESLLRLPRRPAALAVFLAGLILLPAPGCRGNDSGKEEMAALYRNRGASRLRVGDTAGAGRFLSKAEGLEPDSAATQILIGEVLRREGNLDRAEARYRRALALAPDSPEGHLNLGVVLGMKGRNDDALREFQAAARSEQFANRDLAYDNIGQIYLDRQELDSAEQAFRTAVALNDAWPRSQVNLGRVLYRKGDFAGAAQRFARAIRLNPNFVEARYRLALVYIRIGRRMDAIAELRNVIRMAPKGVFSGDAREQLALLE
ncbi:MAG: tetratricopeptide repeat protein [Myxococcota bacterium]